MTLPPRSRGLVSLDEIRACMDRIDATLTVLTAAVKRLGAPVEAPRPPSPTPEATLPSEEIPPVKIRNAKRARARSLETPPPTYRIFSRGGRVAREKGIDRAACPFKGDRGVAGARRRWWLWGFDNPTSVEP